MPNVGTWLPRVLVELAERDWGPPNRRNCVVVKGTIATTALQHGDPDQGSLLREPRALIPDAGYDVYEAIDQPSLRSCIAIAA